MNKVEKTIQFLNKAFDDSEYLNKNLYDKKYRLEHTFRVANIGKTIALKEGFDVEAMIVACLLHDISYCDTFNSREDWLNHGRRAYQLSHEFVKSLHFDKQTENDILYGIAIHVDDEADFEGEKTPFALCIGDADNIDRFDTYRIYETLKNDNFDEMSLIDQETKCIQRIQNLEKLLEHKFATPTSTELFHEKVSFQLEFYHKLKRQLENSKSIL